jgi:hypothetical protein
MPWIERTRFRPLDLPRRVKLVGLGSEKIPLDAERFAAGLTWQEYLAQMRRARARVEHDYDKAALTAEERRFFGGLGHVRYALMLAEDWCAEVHRCAPLVARIAEAMPGCELRQFFRDRTAEVTDCFLDDHGYRTIPLVVFFDRDWNEIARWIVRSPSTSPRVAAIRARTLGAAPPARQFAAMIEYQRQIQAAHDAPGGPLWREAVEEVRLLLEASGRPSRALAAVA